MFNNHILSCLGSLESTVSHNIYSLSTQYSLQDHILYRHQQPLKQSTSISLLVFQSYVCRKFLRTKVLVYYYTAIAPVRPPDTLAETVRGGGASLIKCSRPLLNRIGVLGFVQEWATYKHYQLEVCRGSIDFLSIVYLVQRLLVTGMVCGFQSVRV